MSILADFMALFMKQAKNHSGDFSGLSNNRTGTAIHFQKNNPPLTLLLDKCTQINFWVWELRKFPDFEEPRI